MRKLSVALTAIVAFGCADSAGPVPGSPEPGVLQLLDYAGHAHGYLDTALHWTIAPGANVLVPAGLLDAPDTVRAGTTFNVSVATIGLNGCWRAAGQDVGIGPGVVELTPSDVHSGANVCTQMLGDLVHRSAIVIEAPGEWIVRVRGRRVREGDDAWEEPVSAEKTVVVR